MILEHTFSHGVFTGLLLTNSSMFPLTVGRGFVQNVEAVKNLGILLRVFSIRAVLQYAKDLVSYDSA